MNLEDFLRGTAKPIALLGTAAYLTASVACNNWLFPPPTASIPPNSIPAAAVLQEENLAVIRKYQPKLADIIAAQPWYTDRLTQPKKIYADIGLIKVGIARPGAGYLGDKVMLDGKERDIAIIYDAGLEKTANYAAATIKRDLPKIQSFTNLPISWSMIAVNIQLGPERVAAGHSLAGIAKIFLSFPNYDVDIRDIILHEGGHTVYEQDSKTSPIWYRETMPELAGVFASDGEQGLVKRLSLLEYPGRPPLIRTKPLSQFTLQDHINGEAEHVTRGIYLLIKFRKSAGEDNFAAFIRDTDTLKRTRQITDADLREQMLLHTPDQLKSNVAAMYDLEVFGTETQTNQK